MRLDEFFRINELKIKTFARHAGLDPATVRLALMGCEVNYESMEKIIKATYGKIDFKDLKPIRPAPKRKKPTAKEGLVADPDSNTGDDKNCDKTQNTSC